MRGVGATCTAPKTLRTSQTHDSPGMLQGRRGANAASSAFRQNGVSPRSGRLLGVSQTCPEGERRCWPPAAAEGINAHATGMRWWTKPPVGYRSGPPRPAGADPIQSNPHRTGERNVLSAGADSEASSEAAARRERTAVCDSWASGRCPGRAACTQGARLRRLTLINHGLASSGVSRVYRRRYRAPTASTADRPTDLLSRCTSMPLASTPSLTTRTMSAPR